MKKVEVYHNQFTLESLEIKAFITFFKQLFGIEGIYDIRAYFEDDNSLIVDIYGKKDIEE